MKKLCTLLFVMIIFISPINADSKIEKMNKHRSPREDIIDISTDLDEDVMISDVLHFDELVQEYAENEKMSKDEAINVLVQSLHSDEERELSDRRNKTYRRISKRIFINCWYRPSINFYCESDEKSEGYTIKKIISSGINSEYYKKYKPFAGSIYANLENPNKIYWVLNGDFFDKGIRTVGDMTVSESSSEIEYAVRYSLAHYAYIYKEERLKCGEF